MIKKHTKAIFTDGEYQGMYDWQGGVPLTVGELITVLTHDTTLSYTLTEKETLLEDRGDDQEVTTTYIFNASASNT